MTKNGLLLDPKKVAHEGQGTRDQISHRRLLEPLVVPALQSVVVGKAWVYYWHWYEPASEPDVGSFAAARPDGVVAVLEWSGRGLLLLLRVSGRVRCGS